MSPCMCCGCWLFGMHATLHVLWVLGWWKEMEAVRDPKQGMAGEKMQVPQPSVFIRSSVCAILSDHLIESAQGITGGGREEFSRGKSNGRDGCNAKRRQNPTRRRHPRSVPADVGAKQIQADQHTNTLTSSSLR